MTTEDSSGHMSRRRFVRDAGLATVAVAGLGAHPAWRLRGDACKSAPRSRCSVVGSPVRPPRTNSLNGVSAFRFTKRERGAARPAVPKSRGRQSAGGCRCPASMHGGSLFGFYQHTADTMRRIPFGSNPNGVFDNLVGAPQSLLARSGGREDLVLPVGAPDPTPYTPTDVVNALIALVVQTHAAKLSHTLSAVWSRFCPARTPVASASGKRLVGLNSSVE